MNLRVRPPEEAWENQAARGGKTSNYRPGPRTKSVYRAVPKAHSDWASDFEWAGSRLGGTKGVPMGNILSGDKRDNLNAGIEVLYREAAYLDEQRWDQWLALFVPDCEYWVPSWKNEEELTSNPQAELSHIFYANRAGLEDRIVRIRSRRSPASTPMPRTAHIISNCLPIEEKQTHQDQIRLRSSWVCHVYFPRMHESHAFFGRAEYELIFQEGNWLIARKKTILQNDYIPTMLDIYCI